LGDDNADIFNTGANRTTSEKDDSKKIDETALRNLQVTDLKVQLSEVFLKVVTFLKTVIALRTPRSPKSP
jgi:hypothetical protein